MTYERSFSGTTANLGEKCTLSTSILKESPSIQMEVASKLEELVNKYNISWIPDNRGGGGYFVTPELAKAKGLDAQDFNRRWVENKSKLINLPHFKGDVAPRVMLIEGQELKILKALWKHHTGKSLANTAKVFVCDWSVAYWYLTRGSSTAALEFTNLGATAIAGTTKSYVDTYATSLSEEQIQTKIALLSTYAHHIDIIQEVTVTNSLDLDSITRRFDMVERRGNREVIIYELKRDKVTGEHVKEVLGDRGYLDLARKKYRGKKVRLIFMSPNGIEDAAKRMLRTNALVSYRPVSYLIDRLMRDILRSTPKPGHFKFQQDVFPRILSGLIPSLSLPPGKKALV